MILDMARVNAPRECNRTCYAEANTSKDRRLVFTWVLCMQ